MESLVEVLYFLSTGLLIPVIVVLLGFVVWSLLEIGGFIREVNERHRQKAAWKSFLKEFYNYSQKGEHAKMTSLFWQKKYAGLLGTFAEKGRQFCDNELHLNKLVSDLEIEAAGQLARMSLGLRVGPMLGLMGTLIPLGPALVSLSTGSIEEMARHLVVAFSTTVLGLFVGGMCYGIGLVRRQWYSSDLADIEYIFSCLHADDGNQNNDSSNE